MQNDYDMIDRLMCGYPEKLREQDELAREQFKMMIKGDKFKSLKDIYREKKIEENMQQTFADLVATMRKNHG